MKLPNHEHAVVPRAKIVDYLLSDSHRDGRHKAAFFKRLGFATESWEGLAQTLREHAAEHDVTKVETSPYGHRYVIEGTIHSPNARHPMLRVVWFVETGRRRRASSLPILSEETSMIKELDTVVLNVDLPEHGLSAGDLGTVVLEHKYRGYEVEFMTLDGETVAVVSLSSDQVRPVGRWEIAHARMVTRS